MRVPGRRRSDLGLSFSRFTGRKSASTLACEMSASYMSPCTNFARSATLRPRRGGARLDQLLLPFHAKRARPALRCGDDVAAVARAEVHHEVLGTDLRHVEHLVDQRGRRRHPDHVLARLADVRLVGLLGGLGGVGEAHDECDASAKSRIMLAGYPDKPLASGREDTMLKPLFAATAAALLTFNVQAQAPRPDPRSSKSNPPGPRA